MCAEDDELGEANCKTALKVNEIINAVLSERYDPHEMRPEESKYLRKLIKAKDGPNQKQLEREEEIKDDYASKRRQNKAFPTSYQCFMNEQRTML